jgi:hypothetical protein
MLWLEPDAEPLTGWRLQGIVGRGSRFHGWLLTPQGQVRAIRQKSSHAGFLLNKMNDVVHCSCF